MIFSSPLLVLASLFGGVQPDDADKGPYYLNGQVLDIFDGDRLLLSIRAGQKARKGLNGSVVLLTSAGEILSAEMEFTEVGARHSVVRVKYDPYFAGRFQIGDSLIWTSFQRPPRPLEGDFPRLPVYMQAGGAMIDLTTPAGKKVSPPRRQ